MAYSVQVLRTTIVSQSKKSLYFFTKHQTLSLCFLLFVLYSAFFLHKNYRDINDRAYFGGDTWEYQSMGVNIAKGHGLKFGAVEKFETYRFQALTPVEEAYKQTFIAAGKEGRYSFYRGPVYPFFLGSVYWVFGIHPAVVEIIQLLMLCFVAAFMPLVGSYFWGKRGVQVGVMAGVIFLYEHNDIFVKILTEPLIILSVFFVMLAYMYFESRQTLVSSLVFGLSLALAFLVKGSLWFVPFLFIGYLVYRSFRGKVFQKSSVAIVILACALPVIAYSTFASVKAGKFIPVTTQGTAVLLDGNNERSIKSGTWEPKGTTDPEGLYEKNKSLSTFSKLLLFYKSYATDIPRMIAAKIEAGFSQVPFLALALMAINIEAVLFLGKKIRSQKTRQYYFICAAIYVGGVALAESVTVLLVSTFVLAAVALVFRIPVGTGVPLPVALLFLNFLFLTIITFGYPRFTMVMDMFFILVAVNYVFMAFEGLQMAGQRYRLSSTH